MSKLLILLDTLHDFFAVVNESRCPALAAANVSGYKASLLTPAAVTLITQELKLTTGEQIQLDRFAGGTLLLKPTARKGCIVELLVAIGCPSAVATDS